MQGDRRRAGPAPTAAERALFRRAMSDVCPLEVERRPTLPAWPEARMPDPVIGVPQPSRRGASALPALEVGRAPGLDARTLARLRRGRIRPEARLDLHGRTLEAAHREVYAFIATAVAEGLRCVIVITGKGRLGAASGTIRAELPRWLDQAPLRSRILGFTRARPEDGGDGARYVLLRRAERRKG